MYASKCERANSFETGSDDIDNDNDNERQRVITITLTVNRKGTYSSVTGDGSDCNLINKHSAPATTTLCLAIKCYYNYLYV